MTELNDLLISFQIWT